jgi:hypothetical protein
MFRHAAAALVAVCLTPSWLLAQNAEITVRTPSAAVHRTPSTGSPVVGKAPRGTVLVVTREVGDWVKVDWPESPDGFGYVHVTMGTLSRRGGAPAAPLSLAPSSAQMTTPMAGPEPVPMNTMTAERPAVPSAVYVNPQTHVVGLGGRMAGPTLGYGATMRMWSRKRIGIQVDASRSTQTNAFAPERLSTFQLGPSVLYSLPDAVSDYVWVRPYAGAGGAFHRQSFSTIASEQTDVSRTKFATRAFGGAEFTFASVPRFAVSVDVGYEWIEKIPGFEVGGLGIAFGGHWYVK